MTKNADMWDKKHKQGDLILDDIVRDHPNQFGFIIATALHTAMVVGSGTVDVLRAGDAIAMDGWRGVGTDALRLIGFLGPMGKSLQLLKSRSSIRLALANILRDIGAQLGTIRSVAIMKEVQNLLPRYGKEMIVTEALPRIFHKKVNIR